MSAKPKIFIVDDEERFRTTMSKLLMVRGLEVSTAGDGKEAFKELREKSYDVLILDVRMPGMSGIEVMMELRKLDPFIEVIIMTGYASVDTAKKITELGAYDYMLKPYNIDDLMEKIEAAYDRKLARQKLIGTASHEKKS